MENSGPGFSSLSSAGAVEDMQLDEKRFQLLKKMRLGVGENKEVVQREQI